MTIKVTELDNGLRIATDSMSDAESVVVGAWVGVGTRNEPWNANGVAHLVEHMMFKGTKSRSAYALSTAIENKGGQMNAHTTREETAYYARVLPEEAENAIDIVADMLRHSVFDTKELEREKKVVIQEIGRDLDSPEDTAFETMHALALPKQRIGRAILGSAKVIAGMPRAILADYVSRYYNAANMVVVAAGKIDHEAFVAMAKKRFGSMHRGKAVRREKAHVRGGVKLVSKDIEQTHIILGFSGPGFHARSIYATQLLSVILGGSSASRLFQKVREKRGLVYTVSSAHASFSDAGIFQIYAGTDPKRLRELMPVMIGEAVDLRKHVTRGELARAKSQLRADYLMGKESVMRRAEMLGHQMIAFGRPITQKRVLEQLNAVTDEDVKDMANKIFKQKPILVALGPVAELEDYKKISERLAG